ncbi:MAG: calcium/proton exchanger [bacterium]
MSAVSTAAASSVTTRDRILLAATLVVAVAAGASAFAGLPSPLVFVLSAVALAAMASVVGRSVDGLAGRLGPGATGILQSTLGNLPELFVTLFALQAGLFTVVQATIVGSILANILLVLGLAFVVGGIRHGVMRFAMGSAQSIGILLLLSVAILAIPTLTSALHTPAAGYERELSVIVAIVMLLVFGLSVFAQLRPGRLAEDFDRGRPGAMRTADVESAVGETGGHAGWPFAFAVVVRAITGVGAAFVSDWFVEALTPTMDALGISEAFAGLVIVAIAGNAVENVVGIQLAAKNQVDYALQIILQSPLQVALLVAPVLVLAAPLVGAATFTLVFSPLLLAVLLLGVVLVLFVVFDGTSNWVEGVILVGLYACIAAAFWWG